MPLFLKGKDMEDKLDSIFLMQKKLNDDIIKKRNLPEYPREQWIQKHTLAMMSELAELIDEVNYKWWKNAHEVDENAVKEELVDILHFFVSMCLVFDMTADELFGIYINKNKENFDRQAGRSDKKGYEAK